MSSLKGKPWPTYETVTDAPLHGIDVDDEIRRVLCGFEDALAKKKQKQINKVSDEERIKNMKEQFGLDDD